MFNRKSARERSQRSEYRTLNFLNVTIRLNRGFFMETRLVCFLIKTASDKEAFIFDFVKRSLPVFI